MSGIVMRTLAKSKLIIAGFAATLIIAVPEVSSAQHLWPFDGLFGGLGSLESPAREWRQDSCEAEGSAGCQRRAGQWRRLREGAGDRRRLRLQGYQGGSCSGETLGFSATRDGKPFSIRIFAADGEFSEVKRLQ